MSGLFCAEPTFMYRSPNDKFLLEAYEGGQVVILDLERGTSTAFEDMAQADELKVMLLQASNDQFERNRPKIGAWESQDDHDDDGLPGFPHGVVCPVSIYDPENHEEDTCLHCSPEKFTHPDDDDIPF